MYLRTAMAALLLAAPASAGSADGDWTGGFAGFSLGTLRSTGEAERAGYAGDLLTLDVQNGLFPDSIEDADFAAIAGLSVGYNRQRGKLVAGVELDLSISNSEVESGFSRIDPNPDPIFNGVNTITGYETELGGLGTARLRLGYAIGETLVYGTGGVALGGVENRFSLALPELGYSSPDWSEDALRFGYVIGGGIERQVSEAMRVRAEVLHYDLENATVDAADPISFPGQTISYEFDNSGVIGRLGVSFLF